LQGADGGVHLTSEEIILEAVPLPEALEILAAFNHDRQNWFRRPSIRLQLMALRRVLVSRGHHVGDQLVPTVERALNLR
jgi:hypothetical protein